MFQVTVSTAFDKEDGVQVFIDDCIDVSLCRAQWLQLISFGHDMWHR
jgi:hypothetical protein